MEKEAQEELTFKPFVRQKELLRVFQLFDVKCWFQVHRRLPIRKVSHKTWPECILFLKGKPNFIHYKHYLASGFKENLARFRFKAGLLSCGFSSTFAAASSFFSFFTSNVAALDCIKLELLFKIDLACSISLLGFLETWKI